VESFVAIAEFTRSEFTVAAILTRETERPAESIEEPMALFFRAGSPIFLSG
jgi:hypothetical protein